MLNRIIWTAVLFSTLSLGCVCSSIATGFSPVLRTTQELPVANPNAIPVPSAIHEPINHTNAQKPVEFVSIEDERCLQRNIYFEARNQSTLGQIMVALVTIERKNSPDYPKTICGVVYDHKQFSWANNGDRKPKLGNSLEAKAWERAGILADLTLRFLDVDKPMLNVTHYHATYVNPKWARKMKMVAKIDDHIFYEKPDRG